MDQLLFDFRPRVRKTDPVTSKVAASKVRAGSKRHKILSAMVVMGSVPLTSTTIARALGMPRDSVSPHLKPLETLGYIRRTGNIYVDKYTQTGSETWELTPWFIQTFPLTVTYTHPTVCPCCHRPLGDD